LEPFKDTSGSHAWLVQL